MKKYHINPNTGIPSICRAKNGQCPYGGNYGNENHYDTYSEALMNSQKELENNYKLLPASKVAMYDILETKYYNKITYQHEDLPENEVELKNMIKTTDNVNLIIDILEGKLLIEDDWGTLGVALQNPNLPRDFINQVIYESPEEYHIETRRHIMLNPSLTHKDIIHVVNNSEDLYTKTIALKHPSLKQEYAEEFLKNNEEKLKVLPWHAMLANPSIKTETFADWMVENYFKCELDELSKYAEIDRNYQDWVVNE